MSFSVCYIKPRGTLFRFITSIFLSTYTTTTTTTTSHCQHLVDKFSSLLQESSKSIKWVMSIHAQIIIHQFSLNQYVAAKLAKSYFSSGSLEAARHVFDEIPHPEVFLCNAMLNGYLKCEHFSEALDLFHEMCRSNLEIDSCSCTFALRACTGLSDYDGGMWIVESAAEFGMSRDPFFGCSAINFLFKFDRVDEARRAFDGIKNKDVVCWNTVMGGYVQASCFDEAIDLFFDMREWGIRPSPVTIMTLIQACGEIKDLELGKCIHGFVLALEMVENIMVLTSLISMYNKMGDTESAFMVFERMPTKNLVTWNAMISGCVHNCLVHKSFSLFGLLVGAGNKVDSATFASLLQGCSQTADIKRGKILHGCIFRRGLETNVILSTTLVDLYCKCGSLNQTTLVFNRIKDKNVVTWTALLVGLAQNGQAEDALKLFHQMRKEDIAANEVTLVSLLHSCAHLGSLKKGMSIHAHFMRRGFPSNAIIMTALIDMYAKCGKMNFVESISLHVSLYKDIILWNSLITSYGMHGHGNRAIGVYYRTVEEKIKPDEATFVSLLTACSHSGLVEQGICLFNSMEIHHHIKPNEKHYACIVDLLSRAGKFKEAEVIIGKMPFEPCAIVLEALLCGCRRHKNMELGVKTADKLLQLDASNPGIYIVLSNIYAEAKRWEAVDYIRGLMRKRGLKKVPGFSSVEVGNQLHTFFAGDDSHSKWGEIYRFLKMLRLEVEALGYVPDTSCVLRDLDDKMKVKLLWGHSERLAIAFGILSTPPGSLIRITKNLRVCVDCHSLTKYISKVVKREIVMRDANRFHHFKDGMCSCGDYW